MDSTSVQQGLTSVQVAELQAKFGPNALRELPKEPIWKKFLDQFKSFLIILLLIAVIISAALGEMLDAGVILAIVILNAILGFLQESKAENSLEALKKMVAPQARVMRNGQVEQIEARFLVPGDLLLLEVGDAVPADTELLESLSLEADESSLTGESMPVHKKKGEQVFMGTIVTRGKGTGIVRATGMSTKFGNVAALMQQVENETTPLEEKLEQTGKQIGIAVVLICILIFALNWHLGRSFAESFLFAIALAVAAVPEGLPAIVTVSLALGVQRMAKAKAIVRKLKAVETLGSTTFICTDKTGTLTRNEMIVRTLFAGWKEYALTGTGYSPFGELTLEGRQFKRKHGDEVSMALHIGALCNSAHLKKEGERYTIIGDPTEGALLAMAAKGGVEKEREHGRYKLLAELPFESERKRMTTIFSHAGETVAFTKGQPERVLKHCTQIFANGKVKRLTDAEREELLQINRRYASQAFRVLAFAYRPLTGKENISVEEIEKDLIFVGFATMMDQPREEAKSAIAECMGAGISVVMITGDQKLTAEAVARELGILSGEVITGEELDMIGDDELAVRVKSARVFAAVSPEHKLRIVNALKANKEVTAVTGDGVNDAPAIKQADIGVAMGITGTDVAKEASDMVLMDDNFTTIVHAVKEGRGTYNNIRKAIAFLLSGNIAEVLIVLVAVVLGYPLPLAAIQLLWINLVTDGLPALALVTDPIDKGVMQRPPRPRQESIWHGMKPYLFDYSLILTVIAIGMFAWYLDEGIVKAQTVVFTLIIMFEKFQAFSCRSLEKPIIGEMFANKWLNFAAILTFFLHLAILYVPVFNTLFHTTPLSLSDWALIILASLFGFAYLELYKAIFSRRAAYARENHASPSA